MIYRILLIFTSLLVIYSIPVLADSTHEFPILKYDYRAFWVNTLSNSSKELETLTSNTKKQIFGIETDVKEFYQKIKETISSYQKGQGEKISELEESIALFEKFNFKLAGLKKDWIYSNPEYKHELLYQLIK